ncbi:GntR family transcriptional regulator [Dickeya dianthicola]|nr:GntR family transcriptional regulator [Dickeya dianthicola]MBT1430682.1 GntR family transcriptional regulator [Dickeya dianthicola]MBT1458151.1 GntR family transcriptional regulator [Dickeya dianthicola]MBT1487289.1 GntR family transcriptional regulator [Dickeya dianthicola]QVH40244.1 GntR family transcriptional regulator [Dickeya dianthicola]
MKNKQERRVRVVSEITPSGTAQEAGGSRNEQAYERFKAALISLRYKPGEYLNTAQVMAELSLSRTPIIQAVHRLANEGLLQIIPRKGMMVSPLSLDDAVELIEVRLVNEMLCTRLVCQRCTTQDIAQLRAINQQIRIASETRDHINMMTLDHQFHQQLGHIAGNRILADILSVLNARSQRFWATTLSREGHMQEVVNEHDAIINALEQQDSDAAVAATQAHILSFRHALFSN